MTNILHINNTDERGGAARIAMDLHRHTLEDGFNSYMVVGHKSSDNPRVLEFSRMPKSAWGRLVHRAVGQAGTQNSLLGKALRGLAEPGRYARSAVRRALGLNVFEYPWTYDVGQTAPVKPDIIHCHNLHGTYFDLRALPQISAEFSVVITLHDMWLLTGGCAHPLDCQQWKTGCTSCKCSVANHWIAKAATSRNWRVKKGILQRCHLHIITPSQWLMDQVLQSYLSEAAVSTQVIHNGVSTQIFYPDSLERARAELELPQSAYILLFCANNARSNPWKDYASARTAAAMIAQKAMPKQTLLVVLGDDGGQVTDGALEIRHIPYTGDNSMVADYYRASDLYLHAAHADTFPTTMLESLACGTPVIGTAIGGIPEQIRSLRIPVPGALGEHSPDTATGVLVPHADPVALAQAGLHLLHDTQLRTTLSANAVRDVAERFTIERQVARYLEFYERVVLQKQDREHASSV